MNATFIFKQELISEKDEFDLDIRLITLTRNDQQELTVQASSSDSSLTDCLTFEGYGC